MYPYSLIPTSSPSPTPTPSPTPIPIVGWLQKNVLLVFVLVLMVVFFFMMRGIGFPRELLGDYAKKLEQVFQTGPQKQTRDIIEQVLAEKGLIT